MLGRMAAIAGLFAGLFGKAGAARRRVCVCARINGCQGGCSFSFNDLQDHASQLGYVPHILDFFFRDTL